MLGFVVGITARSFGFAPEILAIVLCGGFFSGAAAKRRPPNFFISLFFLYIFFCADGLFVAYPKGFDPKAPIERSELLIKVSAPFLLVHDLFVSSVNSILPEPEAGLGVGVLLGGKNVLSKSISESFRRAGLSHVIVLSGYNISVVAEAVTSILLSTFGLTASIFGGVLAIIAFALMTGAEVSVIRATIMACVALSARRMGRPYNASIALLFAAIIMVVFDPSLPIFNLSFELSFLASLGILFLAKPIERGLSTWFGKTLSEILSVSLAAQSAVTPLIVATFGRFSFMSLPANVFVAPLVPYAMLATFISGLVGLLSSWIGMLFSGPAYILLWIIIHLAQFFGDLPFSEGTGYLAILGLLVFYIIIGFVIMKGRISVDSTKGGDSGLGDEVHGSS